MRNPREPATHWLGLNFRPRLELRTADYQYGVCTVRMSGRHCPTARLAHPDATREYTCDYRNKHHVEIKFVAWSRAAAAIVILVRMLNIHLP